MLSILVFGCRLSFGSLEAINIPSALQNSRSGDAFGSAEQLSQHTSPSMAIEFTNASFSWRAQPLRSHLNPREGPEAVPWHSQEDNRRSNLVLRNIDLSIPEGKLTIVYGEVGSGRFSCQNFKISLSTLLLHFLVFM